MSDVVPQDQEASDGGPLLDVQGLVVEFKMRSRVVHAVNGLSYSVGRRETVAIVGESGSGKSVSAQAIMGTLSVPPARIVAGRVMFRGVDLLQLKQAERRRLRGRHISIIFQDAQSALDPLFSVGDQISEMYRVHGRLSRRDAWERAIAMMKRVGIPDAARRARDYPHEFSGGMRQRIVIAMALAMSPDVVIADEPTTALDVTVQAQIIQLLKDLQAEVGMGLVLITHDLGLVADVADRVVVMYAGAPVEACSVADLYRRPLHPYTIGLLASVPRVDKDSVALSPISGAPPDMSALPSGCAFHPRCSWAVEECGRVGPVLRQVGPDRRVACHLVQQAPGRMGEQ